MTWETWEIVIFSELESYYISKLVLNGFLGIECKEFKGIEWPHLSVGTFFSLMLNFDRIQGA